MDTFGIRCKYIDRMPYLERFKEDRRTETDYVTMRSLILLEDLQNSGKNRGNQGDSSDKMRIQHRAMTIQDVVDYLQGCSWERRQTARL